MAKISSCTYGGGKGCRRQGGDGSTHHRNGYLHPASTTQEMGEPAGEWDTSIISKSLSISGLHDVFDEDTACKALDLEVDDLISPESIVKSMYDFDLEEEEGVRRLLELLPIMDPEIMADIMSDIWSGYMPEEDIDPVLMRAEIKGFLFDRLEATSDAI